MRIPSATSRSAARGRLVLRRARRARPPRRGWRRRPAPRPRARARWRSRACPARRSSTACATVRGPELAHAPRAARVRREAELARLAQQRLEEERVAAGGLAAGRGELGRDAGAERALAERRRRIAAERRRAHQRRLGRAAQARRARPDRPRPAASSASTATGKAVEARGQVDEEAQRLGVRPVQVVDDERQRLLGGEVVEQPVEPVQHREGAVRSHRRRLVAEEAARHRRRALEGALALAVRERGDGRLEQLAHTAVGEVALEVARPRAQAREAALGSRVAARRAAGSSCRGPRAPRSVRRARAAQMRRRGPGEAP